MHTIRIEFHAETAGQSELEASSAAEFILANGLSQKIERIQKDPDAQDLGSNLLITIAPPLITAFVNAVVPYIKAVVDGDTGKLVIIIVGDRRVEVRMPPMTEEDLRILLKATQE
jgi:hypothetical protein